MIKRINESKTLIKHANVNMKLMLENVILIRSGVKINVDEGVKILLKNIIFGILVHVPV